MGPSEIERFDLSKYGLAYLEGRNVLDLSDADLDRLLEALGDADAAVQIPIPSTPENVERLASQSQCRRCGKCCSPDRPDPDNPGVEALESELKAIAAHLGVTYASLEEKTAKGKRVFHRSYMKSVSLTRFLPLPCRWYDAKASGCSIYAVRPVVCRMHPIVFGDSGQISIRTACDYGKDIIKAAFKELKASHPEMVMRI